MALENIGLGGVLSFDSRGAIKGMADAGRAALTFSGQFNGIVNVAKSVGTGIGAAVGGLGKLGLATAPATAGFGLAVSQASDFEKQMSAVKAVSDETGDELVSSMSAMSTEAKRLGATTKFTATEAGQGMELLKLAGFSTADTLSAIGPVLAAAAADGIGLAQSAEIVGDTLNAMNIPASRAGEVADILAQTSASTSTSIAGLGEALTYSAPAAHALGIEIEETTAMLGLIADAGMKGSAGGTAFAAALEKLATPSKKGASAMEELGITMKMTEKGGLDIVDAFKQIDAKISAMPNKMDQASAMTAIFGVQGKRAFGAIQTALAKTDKDGGNHLDNIVAKMHDAKGAADRMAKARLDNFAGAWESLSSAIEGFNLEVGGAFLAEGKKALDGYANVIGGVVSVMQELNSEGGLTEATAAKFGPTIVAVAQGIKEGVDDVVLAWGTFRYQVSQFIEKFTGSQSGEFIQKLTRIGTVLFIIAGVVGPVVAAFAGLAFFVMSVVAPAFAAVGGMFAAVFAWPVLAAVGAVMGAFLLFHNEGESVSQTFTRLGENIMAGFNWALENGVKPFISGFLWVPNVFGFVWEKVQDFYGNMKEIFGDLVGGIMSAFQALAPFFSVLFTFIGNIVGVAVAGLGLIFTVFLDVVTDIFRTIKNVIVSVVESIVNFIKDLAFGIGTIGQVLGFEWGDKLANFGRDTFQIQAGTGERGMGAPKDEEMVAQASLEASTMVIDQAAIDKEDLANAVGDAVGANMPKDINVESKVCVDGKTVAKSTTKHKQEIYERAGFKTTPWQRRAAAEQGASPVGG